MKIIEVNNAATQQEFIQANVTINKTLPNYIRPLDSEINDLFDSAKNKNYKYGSTKRWILKDEKGILIGRIAAFTNTKYINKGISFVTSFLQRQKVN